MLTLWVKGFEPVDINHQICLHGQENGNTYRYFYTDFGIATHNTPGYHLAECHYVSLLGQMPFTKIVNLIHVEWSVGEGT